MAENKNNNERTEQPTQRRKQQSRKKGQVPRSRELNTMLSLLFGAVGLMMLAGPISTQGLALFESALDISRQTAFDKASLTRQFTFLSLSSLMIFSPFLGIALLGVFAGPLLMGGWSFSPSAMAFKIEKLNPLTGLKRVFSVKGLLELLKALLKFIVLMLLTIMLFDVYLDKILALGGVEPQLAAGNSVSLLLLGLVLLGASLLFIVSFDVPFELWNHNRQLKMTLQEVKDELKETEGRPEVKSRIKTLQREISQRRMMESVPTADVVITNPTHYAVALKYDAGPGSAPRVVAKGRDHVAQKIREMAEHHGVALFSAPPLARALFGSSEIGDEIPQNLYMAVARVLAYIFQLRSAEPGAAIIRPEELDLPDEYSDWVTPTGVSTDG